MTKFFIYLEKILTNVIFFNNDDITKDIQNGVNNDDGVTKNISIIKNNRLEKGQIYLHDSEKEIIFHFKINEHMTYELIFVKNQEKSNSKFARKVRNDQQFDPKIQTRYCVIFHPLTDGPKYTNISLKPQDSTKLFDYIRTCGLKVNKRNFYFDGAYTQKEENFLKKLDLFGEEMEKESGLKDKNKLFNIFLNNLKKVKLVIKQTTIDRIKKIIYKEDFKKMMKKAIFLIRDELNLNLNVRERYFIKLLKKENIKARVGNRYTRTIFFDL